MFLGSRGAACIFGRRVSDLELDAGKLPDLDLPIIPHRNASHLPLPPDSVVIRGMDMIRKEVQ